MGFSTTEGSDLDWLLDQDDTTCNSRRREKVKVTLDTPIPLTWVRIVVNSSGNVTLFLCLHVAMDTVTGEKH